MARQRYQLFPSRDIDDQKILESKWSTSTPSKHSTKSGGLKCYLPLMIIST